MDEVLRQSSWGWEQWVLPTLQGKIPPKHSVRYGWRCHLLRCQFIQGQPDMSLWLEAESEEPELLQLIASTRPSDQGYPLAISEDASPGLLADHHCDRAWHAWRTRRITEAIEAVRQALLVMPGHAEAMVWVEFLKETQRKHVQWSTQSIDHMRLIPTQRKGWLSPERWRRRGLTGRWIHPAPRHTALYDLQERGIHTRVMGTSQWYQAQSMEHPTLPIEALVDKITSHHLSIRDPRPQAWEAWELASRLGPKPIHQLARFLTNLALQNPFLVQIGTLTSGVLRRLEPCTTLWTAAHARLLAEQGRRQIAADLSRSLCHQTLAPESATLIVETLDRCGHHREALRVKERFIHVED